MKLDNRLKRIERVEGGKDNPIVINWRTGLEPITINEQGATRTITLEQWQGIKHKYEHAYLIEVDWIE